MPDNRFQVGDLVEFTGGVIAFTSVEYAEGALGRVHDVNSTYLSVQFHSRPSKTVAPRFDISGLIWAVGPDRFRLATGVVAECEAEIIQEVKFGGG